LSNNSRELRIHITDFFNNEELRGFRISLEHTTLGVLFCCVLQARGSIVTDEDEYGASELTPEEILKELRKYGFEITYEPIKGLSGNLLDYLITLDKLGYDKIRVLNVWHMQNGTKAFETKIVAFQVNPHGDWLNNGYSASEKEFIKALNDGTAINLTDTSRTKNFRWDWLYGNVLSIEDVVEANADQMIESNGI
jgi:hypothetical protein